MAERWIYAQGDFDGACFLYGIVNSYVALTGERPAFERLCAAIAGMDHPGDLLNPNIGTTGGYDGDMAKLADNIRRALSALAGADAGAARFTVTRLDGRLRASDVAQSVGPASVTLLRYQGASQRAEGMDHWVCAVAAEGEALRVACSVRLHMAIDAGAAYAEEDHAGRRSNDALTPDRAYSLVDGEAFVIALAAD